MNTDHMNQIDDYLAGRMSEQHLDVFEEQLLEDPVLQREVQDQMNFREALKAETDILLAVPEPGWLDRLNRWILTPVWAYGATAGLVLVVGFGLVSLNAGSPQSVIGQTAVFRNVELTRSGSELSMAVPSNQLVLLSVDGYGLGASSADLRILRGSTLIVEVPALKADDQELFNVVVGPFDAGEYRVEIIRDSGEPVVAILVVD